MCDNRVIITWIRLYNKGFTIDKIARLYKVKPETIKQCFEKEGVLKKDVKNRVTPEEIKEWIELYPKMTIEQISKKCNRSMYTVSKYLTKANVHKPKITTDKLVKQWIYEYLVKDMSTTLIAKKHGYDRETIRRHLTNFGVILHKNLEIREIENYELFERLYENHKFNKRGN